MIKYLKTFYISWKANRAAEKAEYEKFKKTYELYRTLFPRL